MPTSSLSQIRSALSVSLSRAFMTGSRGPATDPFYIDYPQMTNLQRRTFKYLVKQALTQIPIEGRNKPSYALLNGTIIPDTELYQEFNLWHYHSGCWQPGGTASVYTSTAAGHTSVIDLQSNPLGKTSAPCLHYIWNSLTQVTIVAYSAVHVPFPREMDPNNTLLDQLIDALP